MEERLYLVKGEHASLGNLWVRLRIRLYIISSPIRVWLHVIGCQIGHKVMYATLFHLSGVSFAKLSIDFLNLLDISV